MIVSSLDLFDGPGALIHCSFDSFYEDYRSKCMKIVQKMWTNKANN